MKIVKFAGIDGWSRPAYKDRRGKLWKDINLGKGASDPHSVADNRFDGEPDMPIKGGFTIEEGGG